MSQAWEPSDEERAAASERVRRSKEYDAAHEDELSEIARRALARIAREADR